MNARTLVTGAAGFIGSNLAIRLAADGRDVVAADAFTVGTDVHLRRFAALGGDVVALAHPLDFETLRSLGRFDTIFHQAAVTGVVAADGSADASASAAGVIVRNNVEQFRLLLALAAEHKAALVWASSCSVYGRGPVPMRETAERDPLNAYALSKVVCENLARLYAPPLPFPPVGLRYSNVYGPGESHKGPLASMVHQLARQMRRGERPRIFAHGQQRRDFVYVDDVVQANLQAEQAARSGLIAAGRAFVCNTGANASWSFNDLVATLNAELGTKLEPEYFQNPYAFTQDHTETCGRLGRELIGYVPECDLAEGVRRYNASGLLGVDE